MEPFARIPGRYDDKERRNEIDKKVGKRRHSTRKANLGTFTGYRIGLDVGNGNIGWCVLFEDGFRLSFLTAEDIAAHNAALPKAARRTQLPDFASFVPLGTHKFQAREPGEKAEKSFSKIRAEAKAGRRLLDARQRRRLHLRKSLEDAGLLPRDGEPRQGHREIPADRLRIKLLDSSFPGHPHDLGRALLNVLNRRGWLKPIGRAGKDEESRFGNEATKTYREALKAFQCRTVGEFLERCAQDAKKDGVPFRKRHRSLDWQKKNKKNRPEDPTAAKSYEVFRFLTPTFELIREEACLLRESQKDNAPADNEAWANIEDKAEFRRDLKAKTPGRCEHFPDEYRCVRALPSFQRFRILEQISHLRDPRGQCLDDATFGTARGVLERREKINVGDLSRELGTDRLRLEDEDKGKRTLVGAKTDLALTATLGEAWTRLPIEERDEWTMRFLRRHWTDKNGNTRPWTREHDETALERDAEAAFGSGALAKADGEAAKAFEDTFPSLSLKAVRILADAYAKRLPHEDRLAALVAAGAPEPSLALYERLPYYGEVMPDQCVPATGFAPAERTCAEELAHGRVANPDVHVVMNRIRAVVNEIVGMMGGILPTTCVVEVARSALSEDAANEHTKRAREREKLREAIVNDIERVFEGLPQRRPIGPALDRLVDRWKAAIRQGWRDYDGNRIERSLLVDAAVYQLDHVSPAAFGDFRENNLFVSRFNQKKGRHLPWQPFGDDPAFRPALLAFATFGLNRRIDGLKKALDPKRKMPREKRARLEAGLQRAEQERKRLDDDFETPRPDVLHALRRTLTGKLESLVAGEEDADEGPRRRGAPAAFRPGDQATLFCRFGPDARPPERDFAARDLANIGWSTKLTRRYLEHLGAESVAIKPWAIHALRCMFGLNKERKDLRNHAVDAFLIAHFDARVLRPAFDRLKDARVEELYSTRALRAALDGIEGGQGFFEELKGNIDRLDRTLRTIATAHRADNSWNPGDAHGGSLGNLGGENIYAFRPTLAERKELTAIVAKAGKAPDDGRAMTRKELLPFLLRKPADEPADEKNRKLRSELAKTAELRYWSRTEERRKPTKLKAQTALPLPDQPSAFIDAESKFAIVGASAAGKRRVVPVAEFSCLGPAERAALFADGRPVYRRGDTVISEGKAFVVTGLLGDGRLIAYPADIATRDEGKVRITIPQDENKPRINRFASDVLGRRLHRLRKDSRGLEPVLYKLRGE